jgi:two-component system sensor histidine kinase GlrK
MKISTKITAGYGILIALMIAVLVYQVSLIHDLESINSNLSRINFRAAKTSLQLMRDLDQIEEFAKKVFVTGGDPGYANKLREWQDSFTSNLQVIGSLDLSEKEQVEVNRLSQMWHDFSDEASREVQMVQSRRYSDFPSNLTNHLERLENQTQALFLASQQAIESQVQRSAEAGQQAERISWIAAAVALVLSLLVSFVIVQSISQPLRYLTEGTRAIAEGKFDYQLGSSGNDEFSQLARDFNKMAQRLGELDQMKKDFVSHVSHELKAPLVSMRETIQLLLEQIPGPLTEKQKRLLELNLQSGKRLSAMIANLLDLSRMEAGVIEYELKRQDLVALIRTALAEFEVRAQEKRLRLEVDLSPQPLIVECDADRVIQVIGNLLENALKFSPDGAAIRIRVRHAAEIPERIPAGWRRKLSHGSNGAGFAVVVVSDSGPGVPDAHKEKIFERFHQVKQGKKISGQGVGLGLAICRTIVEAHHGAIWVEDNPDGGSVFYILFPAGATSNQDAYRASSPIGGVSS